MRLLPTIAAVAVALPLGLTAAFANDVAGISRAVQEQTLLACAGREGLTGTIDLHSLNASSPLFVSNGNGIKLRQARNINRCATNAYAAMRANGQVTAQPAPTPVRQTQEVPSDAYRGGKAGFDDTNRVTFSDYQCPPNFTGMFRGTLYCENGVMLR